MQMHWGSKEPFSKSFDELTSRIDELSAKGYQVSLAGVSAGASASILAFLHAPEKVHRVITICGKLRGTVGTLLRTTNPRFSESYDRLQIELAGLSESQKKNILTVYSPLDLYVDESQATLPGAIKKSCKIPGHNLACAVILLTSAKTIIRFIKEADRS